MPLARRVRTKGTENLLTLEAVAHGPAWAFISLGQALMRPEGALAWPGSAQTGLGPGGLTA